jgi:hypothetical protein
LIGLCSRLGVERTLEGIVDVDFQGRSLLRFLGSPRVLTVLVYSLFAYLSANPLTLEKQTITPRF